MKDLKQVLKDAFSISSSQYVAVGISFFTIFSIAKILGPEQFGLWNFFLIILTFTLLGHFGVFNALSKEIPSLIGSRSESIRQETQNVGLTSILISSSAISVMLIVFSFSSFHSKEKFFGYIFIAMISATQILRMFYEMLFRSYGRFRTIAKGNLLYSVLNFSLTVPLTLKLGIYGVYTGALTANLLLLLYYRWTNTEKLSLRIDMGIIRQLFAIGFPIFLFSISTELMNNSGRIITVMLLSTERLGQYSIATNLYTLISLIPLGLYTVLWPKFFIQYGQTKDKQSLKEYVFDLSILFSYFIPPIIVLIVFMIEPVISNLMPKYSPGLPAAKILLWAIFFDMSTAMSGALAILNGEIRKFFWMQLSVVISSLILCAIAINNGLELTAIALISASAYAVFSFILLRYSIKFFCLDTKKSLQFYLKIYSPLLISLILIYLLQGIHFAFDSRQWASDFSNAIIKISAYLLIYAGLTAFLNKKFKLFKQS
jgi:O-antigen/teichoic acid export membrane protein